MKKKEVTPPPAPSPYLDDRAKQLLANMRAHHAAVASAPWSWPDVPEEVLVSLWDRACHEWDKRLTHRLSATRRLHAEKRLTGWIVMLRTGRQERTLWATDVLPDGHPMRNFKRRTLREVYEEHLDAQGA